MRFQVNDRVQEIDTGRLGTVEKAEDVYWALVEFDDRVGREWALVRNLRPAAPSLGTFIVMPVDPIYKADAKSLGMTGYKQFPTRKEAERIAKQLATMNGRPYVVLQLMTTARPAVVTLERHA